MNLKNSLENYFLGGDIKNFYRSQENFWIEFGGDEEYPYLTEVKKLKKSDLIKCVYIPNIINTLGLIATIITKEPFCMSISVIAEYARFNSRHHYKETIKRVLELSRKIRLNTEKLPNILNDGFETDI